MPYNLSHSAFAPAGQLLIGPRHLAGFVMSAMLWLGIGAAIF